MEHDLIVGIAVGEAGGGSIVAAGAPFNVKVSVRRCAGCGSEDAVVPRRPGDLVHRKRKDGVGETGIGQAAQVEVIDEAAETEIAVGASRGRGEGVTVETDLEGQGDRRAAVVAVVARVSYSWDNCTGAVGDRV